MAYNHDLWRFLTSIEHEYKYAGKWGAKGEKRQPRKKATPEQIRLQNQRNKENRTRRLIKANFIEKDLWCCLKYPAGTRIAIEDVKSDKKHFLEYMRNAYKKRGSPLKWIARMEVGERGGIHFHILINRIQDADLIITDAWSKALKKSAAQCSRTDGLVDYRSVYESGDMKALAEYMCKQPKEDSPEYEQISLFEKDEQKALLSLTTSRNLIRPEPEHEEKSHYTMRKIIENGPTPTPGYYIDMDSLYIGVNPYTGYSYCRYTEIKLPENRIKTRCGTKLHPPRGDDIT